MTAHIKTELTPGWSAPQTALGEGADGGGPQGTVGGPKHRKVSWDSNHSECEMRYASCATRSRLRRNAHLEHGCHDR